MNPMLVRSMRLGFLGPSYFAAKPPDYAYWILLDFLGFSRPNRDFSMGYAGFSTDVFSQALSSRRKRRSGLRRSRSLGRAELFMGASLLQFLIICNKMSSNPSSTPTSRSSSLRSRSGVAALTSGRTPGVVHVTLFAACVLALALAGCNANQGVNPSSQPPSQVFAGHYEDYNPYDPISYAQNNTGRGGGR
jgi:hypothetical protein